MRKIWFTSDLHFWHRNVIRYCGRPFVSVEEMERVLIDNWNQSIKDDDMVYVLGDVFFCGTIKAKEIMSKLNGYKILIRGNHDQKANKMLEIGFNEVHERLELGYGNRVYKLNHFPYKPKTNDIPQYVLDIIDVARKEQRATGQDSSSRLDELVRNYVSSGVLTNEQGDRLISYDMRFMNQRYEDEGGWLLCGHIHDKWRIKGRMLNVGVDVHNFKPISIEDVEAIIASQEAQAG